MLAVSNKRTSVVLTAKIVKLLHHQTTGHHSHKTVISLLTGLTTSNLLTTSNNGKIMIDMEVQHRMKKQTNVSVCVLTFSPLIVRVESCIALGTTQAATAHDLTENRNMR
jgi:hypothetical protein